MSMLPAGIERQITEEGPRNAIVKLTGLLTSSDVSITPVIALTDFVNNDVRMVLRGLRVDMLEYSIGGGVEILLAWNASSPQQIFYIAGRGKIYSSDYGGFVPDRTRAGYTGDINLSTTGFVPGMAAQNFTVVLELVKQYSVN